MVIWHTDQWGVNFKVSLITSYRRFERWVKEFWWGKYYCLHESLCNGNSSCFVPLGYIYCKGTAWSKGKTFQPFLALCLWSGGHQHQHYVENHDFNWPCIHCTLVICNKLILGLWVFLAGMVDFQWLWKTSKEEFTGYITVTHTAVLVGAAGNNAWFQGERGSWL